MELVRKGRRDVSKSKKVPEDTRDGTFVSKVAKYSYKKSLTLKSYLSEQPLHIRPLELLDRELLENLRDKRKGGPHLHLQGKVTLNIIRELYTN